MRKKSARSQEVQLALIDISLVKNLDLKITHQMAHGALLIQLKIGSQEKFHLFYVLILK